MSAKENRGIRETFEVLTREVMGKTQGRTKVDVVPTTLSDRKVDNKKKKGDCCS